MKLAVIPARGGSKRIPRKNVKHFAGKPMIAWSIAAARQSGCFDHVIVSTDDAEIISIARKYGAEAPFTRPEELSGDHTPTAPVIRHAIEWWKEHKGEAPEYICCLYATAPFVTPEDIREGLRLVEQTGSAYAFPVTTFPFPIQRALKMNGKGGMDMFYPEHMMTRSQDLEEAYHDAGQFYWGRAEAWLSDTPVFTNAAPVILPRWRVQDIDTMEDWDRAEALFAALRDKQAGAA